MPSPSVKNGFGPIEFPPTQWSEDEAIVVINKDLWWHSKSKFVEELLQNLEGSELYRQFETSNLNSGIVASSHLADIDALVSNINKLDRQGPVLPKFQTLLIHPQ